MALLPTSLGTRPRLAVELRPEGVVAARAEDAEALVSAVAYSLFAEGTLAPGLKAGNVAARASTVAAVRKALEAVALKERQTTLILPDAAVRVLLLDFDALPTKPAEALPIVRFRLKKLLPFDSEDAVVSYQVMSSTRGMVRVLAVAIPGEVLAEYESIVRDAGFEPGAVLPSTLAACAGLSEIEAATLLVNAGETGVTTAIVQGGILLLHRTVDLAAEGLHEHADAPPGPKLEIPRELLAVPLVEVESSEAEWAAQQPLSSYGTDNYNLRRNEGGLPEARFAADAAATSREEMLPPLPTPQELESERLAAAVREVTQAVSVAAAYFEDTLQSAPGLVLAAGTLGAEILGNLLREAGFGAGEMRVKEMLEPAMLGAGAASTRVPHGWIAGVRGALRS